MIKRNIGFTRSLMKLIGATLAFSLLISPNVHAEELDDLIDSEGITTISEGIDNLNNQVDALSENCADESMSSEISNISNGINSLDDQIDLFADGYAAFMAAIFKNKADIISGLNSNVYVMNKIPESATYADIISKINDIKYHGTIDVTLDNNDKYTLESGYYDGGTIDVSAIIEAARQEGIKEGEEKGYKAGKADGDRAGYERGLAEGKKVGKDGGYKEGLEAGKEYMMTTNNNWLSINGSSSIALSPLKTYKPYRYIYIKCINDHGVSLKDNYNDGVCLWVKSGDDERGQMAVAVRFSDGINLGGGWYQFGAEGISMVDITNKNNVSRDYIYHFSN